MEIITEINIGDTVYYLEHNKIKSNKVEGFLIQVGYIENNGTWKEPHYTYQLENKHKTNFVYKTKEDLVSDLLK